MALVQAYDRNNNAVYVRDAVLEHPVLGSGYSPTPFVIDEPGQPSDQGATTTSTRKKGA